VRSLSHVANRVWQLVTHAFCAILFFGMGVKLPAKLAEIDRKRIIAAIAQRPHLTYDSQTMSRGYSTS
jgi:hypothetical protein